MNHERLICYQLLMDVAKRMPSLTNRLPRGEAYIIDQLKRALSSAILNLSEGNGRTSQRERNRFFDISLASIAEVSSAIDIISAYGYIAASFQNEIRGLLIRSHSMILKLKKIDSFFCNLLFLNLDLNLDFNSHS